MPDPTFETLTAFKYRGADAIIVAEVVLIEPRLVSSHARSGTRDDWIRSDVEAVVLDGAKDWRIPQGRLSFEWEGGELLVGGTVVEATLPWAQKLEVGQRYLFFCNLRDDGNAVVSEASTYEVMDQGVLQTMYVPHRDLDGMNGLRLADVMSSFRELDLVRHEAR